MPELQKKSPQSELPDFTRPQLIRAGIVAGVWVLFYVVLFSAGGPSGDRSADHAIASRAVPNEAHIPAGPAVMGGTVVPAALSLSTVAAVRPAPASAMNRGSDIAAPTLVAGFGP